MKMGQSSEHLMEFPWAILRERPIVGGWIVVSRHRTLLQAERAREKLLHRKPHYYRVQSLPIIHQGP